MSNIAKKQYANVVSADSTNNNVTEQTLEAQVMEEDITMQSEKVREDMGAQEQAIENNVEVQGQIEERVETLEQVVEEKNKEGQEVLEEKKETGEQVVKEKNKEGQEEVSNEKKDVQEQVTEENAQEHAAEVEKNVQEQVEKDVQEQNDGENIEETISTIEVSQKIETNSKNNFITFAGILLFVLVIILVISQFIMRRKKALFNRKKTNNKSRNKMENTVADSKNVTFEKADGMLTVKPIAIQNIGQRESQQDSFSFSNFSNPSLVKEKGVMAIVADGMGGLKNGAEVSGIVAYVFKDYFDNNHRNEDVTMSYLNMLQEANTQVKDYVANTGGSMSGSTVVSVIIKEGKMNFISVGDSRIYLLRNSKLIQLNREHIYAYELDYDASVGRIGVGEAYRDPQRNSLTSYVGQEQIEQIDYNREPLEVVAGDKVLLMSDGVFGTLNNQEIINAVDKFSLEQGAENLEIAVLEKQKKMQDNFTAVILEIQ